MIRLLVVFVIFYLQPSHTFFDQFMYPCSSAMVCVDIAKCDKIGWIAKNDVILTEDEEFNRAPLLPCRKTDGEQGVCCRDPDYKDDWPLDVSEYDKRGQWKAPTLPPIIGSDSKTTEIKACNPPLVKLPNGICGKAEVVSSGSSFGSSELIIPTTKKTAVSYLPPTSAPQKKQNDQCAPNEVRLPNGECGVPSTKPPTTYLPPTTPCPKGTKQGPNGCEVKFVDFKPEKQVVVVTKNEKTVAPKVTPTKPATTPCPKGTKQGPNGCEVKFVDFKPEKQVVVVTKNEKTVAPKVTPPQPPKTTPAPPVRTTLPYVAERTYLPPVKPSSVLKSDDYQGQCIRGNIIEQNNKRYCCELLS